MDKPEIEDSLALTSTSTRKRPLARPQEPFIYEDEVIQHEANQDSDPFTAPDTFTTPTTNELENAPTPPPIAKQSRLTKTRTFPIGTFSTT